MTFIAVKDLFLPQLQFDVGNLSLLINATGAKAAFVGRVFYPNRASSTKDIRKVHFLFGTVTKAGGSGLIISLQDVDTANGPPGQPDGTQDQTYAIANGNASFASNTWFSTGNLSADRTVSFGQLLAVVIEYDGSGRLGADAVNIVVGDFASSVPARGNGPVLFTSSWAVQSASNNVVLEFSDGTFGALDPSFVFSSITGNTNVNTGTTPDELALAFQVPFACKVDGAWARVTTTANTRDLDIVLYAGTSALATASVDANTLRASGAHDLFVSFAEQTLTAGTQYYLAVKPTTANSVQPVFYDVANANYLSAQPGDTNFNYASRTDAGAWTAIGTRRLMAGLRISAIDDGTGNGGGGSSGGAHILGGTVVR